jgi:hypothetical protein
MLALLARLDNVGPRTCAIHAKDLVHAVTRVTVREERRGARRAPMLSRDAMRVDGEVPDR